MKKFLTIFLCILMISSLTGCTDVEKTTKENRKENIEEKVEKEENPEQVEEVEEQKHPEQPQNQVSTPVVQEPSCTPKKFSNKYTYVYDSSDTCRREGNNVYMDVTDNGLGVSTYGCEEIVDECGNKYYGLYFNAWDDATGTMKKVYY